MTFNKVVQCKIHFMRIISKILALIGITVLVLTSIKCDKDPSEENLKISIDAAGVELSPSSSFDFDLVILSGMPESGVTIHFAIKGEIDDRVYFEKRVSTKSGNTKLTIYGLPTQIWCICSITVTSNNNTNNVATASFRIGRK